MTHPTISIDFRDLRKVAEGLFAEAVAQGMHSPFGLDCEYWGRKWTDRLFEGLEPYEEAES